MTSTSRTEYANALLPNYPPQRAVDILRERLNGAKLLNDAVADWLKERARLEEQYAFELEKLARKKLQIGSSKAAEFHEQVLGTFAQPWSDVVKAVRENSQASSAFAQKLKADIEAPLRQYSSRNVQWADVRQLHDGLMSIADKLDDSEDHYNRAKASRRENSGANLAELRSQWENQAPYGFEQFEKVDESRLVFLKDSLTRFETLEADRAQVAQKQSENVLNSMLTFEPIEDIRSFSARVLGGDLFSSKSANSAGGLARPGHRQSSRPQHHGLHAGSRTATDSTVSDDSSSIYSGGTTGTASTAENKSNRDSVSGLHLRSKVGSIFRGGRKKKDHLPSPASIPENGPSPARGPPAPISRQGSRLSETTGAIAPPRSEIRRGPLVSTSQVVAPPPPPSRKTNGPSSPVERNNGDFFRTSDDIEEPDAQTPNSSGLRVNIRNESITEEKEEGKLDDDVALSTLATTLRSRSTISGRGNRGRRDIQSKLFTNIEPSEEELRGPNVPPKSSGPLLSQLQSLGHPQPGAIAEEEPITPEAPVARDSAVQQPAQPFSSQGTGNQQQPIIPSFTGNANLSDAQSIRSLQSQMSTTTLVPARHPELLPAPGLNGTVIELISTTVQDGVITSPTVSGEVAIGYNGEPLESDSVYLRFVNAGLDKVVPNPQFVQQISPGEFKSGTSTPGTSIYKVDLKNLYNLRYGAIGLKYSGPYGGVPVVFTPIWRVEPNQSSLMLTYKLSEEVAAVIDHIVLNDLVIAVPVQGGPALSAQSKPPSTFNKDKQRVVWRFNQPVTVKKDTEGRVLCRFTTADSPCFEGANGIDIKFRIYPAPTFQLEYQPVAGGNDPFKDDPTRSLENLAGSGENWIPMSSLGTLAVGKYTARAVTNVQKRL